MTYTTNNLFLEQYHIHRDPQNPGGLIIFQAPEGTPNTYSHLQLGDIIRNEASQRNHVSLYFSSALSPVLYEMLQQVNGYNISVNLPDLPNYSIEQLSTHLQKESDQITQFLIQQEPELTLPLHGISKKGKPFSIDEIKESDIDSLAEMIQRMRSHQQHHHALLRKKDGLITSQNIENSYRIFWFFDKPEESPHDLARAFYEKAKTEREDFATGDHPLPARNTYRLAIRNQDNKMIGGITIDMLPNNGPLCDQGDIGYFIDPKEHGKGYVTAAVYRLLPFYFRSHKELSIDIVTQKTEMGLPSNNGYTNNVCSQMVAHKLGAVPTSEPPAAGFEGYTPWRLNREVFLTRHISRIVYPPVCVSHQGPVDAPKSVMPFKSAIINTIGG